MGCKCLSYNQSIQRNDLRSFIKCGLSNKLDGSEDHLVNIRGIEDYTMPKPEKEFHLVSSEDESESESEYEEGRKIRIFN